MPQISLTDFTSQQADIQRRQKLAEMLSEQGQQDIPIQSYNGTQAAIPWTAVLAKALQSTAGAYISHKNSDESDALRKKMLDAQNVAIDSYNSAGSPAANAAPLRNDDYAGAAAAGPSGPSPQNIASALASDPTAAPQAPPPQAMAAALGPPPAMASNDDYAGAAQAQAQGVPPPMPPPQPAPMAAAPAQAAPPPPVPGSIEDRAARAHAQLQAAMQMQKQFGATFAAPYLKAAQEQSAKIQDIQDTAAEKQADRAAAVARTTTLINATTAIPDAMKPAFLAGAQADPDLAKTIMAKMVGDAFTHSLVPAPPEMLAGYPQGTVAQMDPVTKKLENIYNPVPNLMAIANEKLHAQEVSLSGRRLAIEAHNSQRADAQFAATTAGMPAEVSTAFNTALSTGKLPPNLITRTMGPAAWGKFFLENPAANATQINAVARGAASPVMQRTLANLQAIPDTVTNLVSAGKALNYPDLKIAGIAEKWQQGQVNDPKLVNYLTQRKDAILSLAQAFRGTSATDQATKLEEEAMHPTLSPRALEGWAKGQLTAALPKITAYSKYDPSGDTAKSIAAIQAQIGGLGGGGGGGPVHQPYADPAKEARYQAWLKAHGG